MTSVIAFILVSLGYDNGDRDPIKCRNGEMRKFREVNCPPTADVLLFANGPEWRRGKAAADW